MTENPMNEEMLIRLGQPLHSNGLTFYPVTMKDYAEFMQLCPALCLRQSTFPAKYMSLDYISAIFQMELDATRNNSADNENIGILSACIRFLYLCLRQPIDLAKDFAETLQIVVGDNDNSVILKGIKVKDENGEEKYISPRIFSSVIRPLLARQNGFELPDESENPELVEAAEMRKTLLNKGKVNLKVNIDDLVSSVALNAHINDEEIWEKWTIKKFETKRRAIDRDKRYMLCGQAEMSGMVSFKDGNPAPSWQYDAIDKSLGTVSVDSVVNKLGGTAEQRDGV